MNYKEMNNKWKEKFFRDKGNLTLEILNYAKQKFPTGLVMSSSFGKYSVVMLHLTKEIIPDIPVINIKLKEETKETQEHRKKLTELLNLNLRIFDLKENKKQTLQYALEDLEAKALMSGVMSEETEHRKDFEYIMWDNKSRIYRIHPVLDWKENDLVNYIQENNLPINENYRDIHKEQNGKKECGIHLFQNGGGI